MVSKEKIEEFKILYKDSFNVALNDEEATRMANDLVNLMKVILKPNPQEANTQSTSEERSEHETIRLSES